MTEASGQSVEPVGAAPTGPDEQPGALTAFDQQAREVFLTAIAGYLEPDEDRQIHETLALASDAFTHVRAEAATQTQRRLRDAIGTATILAESLRIDVVTLAAVLLEPLVDAHALTLRDTSRRLGAGMGEQVTRAIGAIERFDALHRPGATLRRQAHAEEEEGEPLERDRRKG
ncbi:MAG TPA: hypothetical protein VIC27_09660, partial [Ktedonobacterales bacterium]